LDYYLIDGATEGIVVEEFVRAADHTTVGLDTAGWTPADASWWSSAAFSRAMRGDPHLRARVVAGDREAAEAAYRRLGGGALPDEATLRGYFRDRLPLATAPPLRLRQEHGTRVYRVLLAGDPRPDRVAAWPATGDQFTWELRRIGGGIAWAVDVTARLAGSDEAVGPLLRELTAAARRQGLIPVTTERLG
jgi:hypothetical protein